MGKQKSKLKHGLLHHAWPCEGVNEILELLGVVGRGSKEREVGGT